MTTKEEYELRYIEDKSIYDDMNTTKNRIFFILLITWSLILAGVSFVVIKTIRIFR